MPFINIESRALKRSSLFKVWSLKVIIDCGIHAQIHPSGAGDDSRVRSHVAQAWGRESESQHAHAKLVVACDPRAVRVQAGGQLDLAGWWTLSRIPRLKGVMMKDRAAHLTSSCVLQEHRLYLHHTHTRTHLHIYTPKQKTLIREYSL